MTFALLLGLLACGQDAIPTAPSGPEQNALVATVSVQPSDAVIQPDDQVQLSAHVRGARGQTVNGRPVVWSTSDESIAYVDASGRIVAGREGSATVTADVLGVRGSATIDVRGDVVEIIVSDPSASLEEGSRETLEATYLYSNGATRPAGYLKWTTSNPSIVWVDGEGRITATGAGDVQVIAEGRGKRKGKDFRVKGGTVQTVTAHASSTDLTPGEKAEAWAVVVDKQGRRLFKTPTWSSSNPSVVTVASDGLVTGQSVGQATINATVSGVTGSIGIQVSSAPPSGNGGVTNPKGVTDLAVTGASENSLTLRFTEVDDGTGSPAHYEVRYLSSGTFDWNKGLEVREGSCTAPITGSSIGATKTCTVLGLPAATAYQVRLVSFRGSQATGTAVFGPLSNVAVGATQDPAVVVDVTPSAFSVDVGAQRQVAASVTDSYGNPLEQSVTWTTSRSSVASVSSGGLVGGVSAGEATIRATADGTSSTSAATVVNPSGEGGEGGSEGGSGGGGGTPAPSYRPNEPAGFTMLFDWAADAPRNRMTDIRFDAPDEPASPPSYGRTTINANSAGGSGSGARNGFDFAEMRELYVAHWVRLQGPPGSEHNWEQNAVGTKLLYLNYGKAGQNSTSATEILGDGIHNDIRTSFRWGMLGFYYVNGQPTYQGLPSNGWMRESGGRSLVVNQWLLIENYFKLNDVNQFNGVVKTWVNGVLIAQSNQRRFISPSDSHGFYRLFIDNIWGGGTPFKSNRNDYVDSGHLYISGIPK